MALTKEDLKQIKTIVEGAVFDSEGRIKSEIQSIRVDLGEVKKKLEKLEEKVEQIWKSLNEDFLAEHNLIEKLQHKVKILEKRINQFEAAR